MGPAAKTQRILVVGRDTGLFETARRAVATRAAVDAAADAGEAWERMAQARPDIILIGDVGSPEAAARLYGDLGEHWIARHASRLAAVPEAGGASYRILGEEDESGGIGPYALRGGSQGLRVPSGALGPELEAILARKLEGRQNRLKNALLDPGGFCTVWEQIPGPGAFEKRQAQVLDNARAAAGRGIACAISITDNPGGNPAIATDVLCAEIRRAGIDPLVHIAFRDRNRNLAESLLFQLAALDVRNILVLTGDYPSDLGYSGRSKPVFDLDSVNGLRLVREMNRGLERTILRRQTRLGATDFFAGVAFSPFKQMEAEVMGQYYKMAKKAEAGADFAITQVGYDARKLDEFLRWLRLRGYKLPVLAAVYVLSYPVARAMHDNHVPGCVVTEKLLAELAEESRGGDGGVRARLDRAAKMYAVAKGLGFRGAYVSGQNMPLEHLEYIVTRGSELAGSWRDLLGEFDYPQKDGFYLFERDDATGWNTLRPAPRAASPETPAVFTLSRAFHDLLFEPGSALFGAIRRGLERVESRPLLVRILHSVERWIKSLLYDCKDCGDCALFDTAYLCPVSQCPKDQRNGPCGGSYRGWCEVYPDTRQCVWVRAYARLKSEGKEGTIETNLVPPCDWNLWQTSSWINYFLGRDHSARSRGIRPPGGGRGDRP